MKFRALLLAVLVFGLVGSAGAVPDVGVFPIAAKYYDDSFGIVGGVRDGKWLGCDEIAKFAKPSDDYTIYGWERAIGHAAGTKYIEVDPEHLDNWADLNFPASKFANRLCVEGRLAAPSSVPWPVFPRTPVVESPDRPEYLTMMRGFLDSKGLSLAPVNILGALSVDLDGDGKSETVIYAASVKKMGCYGDMVDKYFEWEIPMYTCVVVAHEVDGRVRVSTLSAQYMATEKQAYASEPEFHRLAAVGDVDGDGSIEVVTSMQNIACTSWDVWKLAKGRVVRL